jgi:hypothetical protein
MYNVSDRAGAVPVNEYAYELIRKPAGWTFEEIYDVGEIAASMVAT